MADASFTNFFNNSQTFGMNVKVPTRTLEQLGKTGANVANVFEPLFTYLEENENVFSGDITHELNKLRVANFNTQMLLDNTDVQTNGARPKFDTTF